jgi:MFS superfamily sulfate permease-like transporter
VYGNTVQNAGVGALTATSAFIVGGWVVGAVVVLAVALLLLRAWWRKRVTS